MGIGAAVALGVSVLGTGASIAQQRKAQRAQRRADAVSRAQAELENQRNIRQAIAAGKLQRAQLTAAGQTQTGGFGGSSAVTGALGAAQTQAAANVGFAQQTQAATSAINRQGSIANNALSAANIFQGISTLPTAFGFDPKDAAKKLFSRN